MEDSGKRVSTMGGGGTNLISDLKSLFSIIRTRKTLMFAYGFMFTFLIFTAFLAFSPSATSFSPWLNTFFSSSTSSSSSSSSSSTSANSSYSSLFTFFFPNSSQPISGVRPGSLNKTTELESSGYNSSTGINVSTASPSKEQRQKVLNQTVTTSPPVTEPQMVNQTVNVPLLTQPTSIQIANKSSQAEAHLNVTVISPIKSSESQLNQSASSSGSSEKEIVKEVPEQKRLSNLTTSLLKQSNVKNTKGEVTQEQKKKKKKKSKDEDMLSSLKHCDIFDGHWVRDDNYPLYPPGSCPHIDESFNCFLNGRPDADFLKLRWQPKDCNIPKLNGRDMLELLRGKRLVFVGDSLNRNMWESLVCTLTNSVRDKTKVFEASGRREFRTENSYLFVFKDYNCTIEFFRSPFLVQEWEMPEPNGSKKETLRLDIVERSSSKYKTADIIVFNTGHWWTHEKTSKGKDYYQEGGHVYDELNVMEAFRKALTTWARWVDANVDPKKTLVFFRGYSASHFSGGQWNSGGQCDNETEPIKNETYLSVYPPKMRVLESVLNEMKMPVSYLNITRMTDYRKEAHPSIYRKQHLSEEERRSPLRYQDCSHWCLPGVPDAWNELLYAKLLVELNQKQQ